MERGHAEKGQEDCTARLPKEDKATPAGDVAAVRQLHQEQEEDRARQGKPVFKRNSLWGLNFKRKKHHDIHTSL